jgi:hypothetical protein
MPMEAMRERWGGMDGNEFQLNSAGLTIAKLADALEQANETAEMYHESSGDHLDENLPCCMFAMRANRKELIG